MKVFVDLSGTRRLGHVVKINTLTTIVRILTGARKSDYIKRHNVKHNVTRYVAPGEDISETIYTSIRHLLKYY